MAGLQLRESDVASSPPQIAALRPLPPIRRSFPSTVSIPAFALLYGVLVPTVKTLEYLGLWPRLIARPVNRAAFGDYEPTAHDVLACSYQKSGTNWLLQIAVQIAHRGHAQFENIRDLVSWPDSPVASFGFPPLRGSGLESRSPTGLRCIKTHLALGDVPYTSAGRYVALVRDPKDVFVSSYHFVRALLLGPMMPTVAHWLDLFLSEGYPQGCWARHLNSYWRVRDRGNVLFLTYESLQDDLPGAVRRIATLAGVELSPEESDAVARQATFTHMKQLGPKFEPPMITPWSVPQGSVVRQGRRGSSDQLLTAEQQRRIDVYFRERLSRLGCDFPYDEHYGRKGAGPDTPVEPRPRGGHPGA